MNRLEKLAELRSAAVAAVEALVEARKAITDAVEAESRSDLTEDETVAYRAKTKEIAAAQAKVTEIDDEIADLRAEEERAGKQSEAAAHVARAQASVSEVKEPLTYQKGDGKSYFRDLARLSVGMADEGTKERLQRHSVDVGTNAEIRKVAKVGDEFRNLDRNDGTGGSFIVATVAA